MSRRMTKTSDFSDDDLLPSASTTTQKSSANPTSNSGNSSSFSLQKSFEASAFKTINGQYQIQGRYGIAILASSDKLNYKLLIYASASALITQVILTPNFQLTISNKVYASFYDSYGISWSLLFDNEERLSDFVRYVIFVKFALGKYSSVTWCDIISGDGEKVEMGDSVEIKFTGYVLQENGTLGNVFETNNVPNSKFLRVKLGKSKTIDGWNEALIGIQKGTRRMLIIPASKGYGSKGNSKIPPNSNLYFEVEAMRLRNRRESNAESLNSKSGFKDIQQSQHSMSASLKSGDEDDITLPSIPIVNDEKNSEVKQRSRSLSQKLDQKSSKQALLSRMAKMGQAMLPPGATSKNSDSDADSEKYSDNSANDSVAQMSAYQPITSETGHRVVQPIPVMPSQPVVTPQSVVGSTNTQQEAIYQQQVFPSQSIYQVTNQPSNQLATYTSFRMPQMQTVQPVSATYIQQSQGSTQSEQIPINYEQHQQQKFYKNEKDFPEHLHSAMLVNETRQQNTEVRISIGKLQDKIDDVLTLVREIKSNEKISSSIVPTVPSMETSVMLQNLTRIIQENEHLKKEVFQKSEKIENQNRKISDLLAKNQTYMEESNQTLEKNALTLHSNASSTQQKILSLEEQKLKLVQELSARTSEIYELQVALDKARKKVSESNLSLSENIDKRNSLQTGFEALKITNRELEDNIDSLKSQNKNLKETARSLEQKIESLEENIKELQQEHNSSQKFIKEKLSKLEDEKRQLLLQFDREKVELSREIDELREKLRQERASVYSDVSLKQNQIEEEVTARWKKRCDRLVTAEVERFERQIAEINEDKERVENDYESALKKLSSFKSQTREMKQSLLDEIQRLTSENEVLIDKIDEMEASKQKTKEVSKAEDDLNLKIKTIMNNVFHAIKNRIHADKTYDGSKVHAVVMEIIRKTTLSLTAEISDDETEEDEEEDEDDDHDSAWDKSVNQSYSKIETENESSYAMILEENIPIAQINHENKDMGDERAEKLEITEEEMNKKIHMKPDAGDGNSSPDNTSDLVSVIHDEILEQEALSSLPTKEDFGEKEPPKVNETANISSNANPVFDENIPKALDEEDMPSAKTESNEVEISNQIDCPPDNGVTSENEALITDVLETSGFNNTKLDDAPENLDKIKDEQIKGDEAADVGVLATDHSTDKDAPSNLLNNRLSSSTSKDTEEKLPDSTAEHHASDVQMNSSFSAVREETNPNIHNASSKTNTKNDAFSGLFSDDEDNDADSIFSIPKKEPKKEPIDTAQVKMPVKSLFGDDDDDMEWLNS